MHSMTGFGRAERTAAGWRCQAELRSVNGRYLEVRLRLPGGLTALEEPLRRQVRRRLERGKVDGTVTLLPEAEGEAGLGLNRPLLRALRRLLDETQATLERPVTVSLGDLLGMRDLVQFEAWDAHREALEALAAETVGDALDHLLGMRRTEGTALQAELREHLSALDARLEAIAPLTAAQPALVAGRLRESLARLTDTPVPDERIAQEVALLAERADVTEELARFRTHLDHLRGLLDEPGAVGRRIEFLLQELNREANTLGVKSGNAEVSAHVIEIKAGLEKLREQIQNVE